MVSLPQLYQQRGIFAILPPMIGYVPTPEILDKYARVLVNFALNSGKGVKKGEIVRLIVSESAKPLYVALGNQVLRSGAIPITDYAPDDVAREYFELASEDQLKFFPAKYVRGLVDQIEDRKSTRLNSSH